MKLFRITKLFIYIINLAAFVWSAHSFVHNYIHPLDTKDNLIVLVGFGGLNTSFIVIGSFLHYFISLVHSLSITLLLTISITSYVENTKEFQHNNLDSVWYNFNYNTTINFITLIFYIILGIHSLNRINEKNNYNYVTLDNNEEITDDEVFINSEINITSNQEKTNKNKKCNIVLEDDSENTHHKLKFCNL